MKPNAVIPCLWFDNRAEQAAEFYVDVFENGHVGKLSRYSDTMDNPGGRPRGSVLIAEFEIMGFHFTALNGGPMFSPNPSISFFVNVGTREDASRIFSRLAEGGNVLMPIDSYPWSPRYGWVEDRFCVSWQVMAGRLPPGGSRIVPCFMFSGKNHGLAETAMNRYASLFQGGRTESVERYASDEGPKGLVKHGRFTIAGVEMVAMDSHISNGVTFTEGVSLQVMCENQGEIDTYWTHLSEDGEEGFCGWLKDRFGVSWQIVPKSMAEWVSSRNAEAKDRTFQAMFQMKKLDVSALKAAFDGQSEPTDGRT
jgi:predicted 3-demethylubiquinone-9 3-methyltransferase (glyoxalase superfamily)